MTEPYKLPSNLSLDQAAPLREALLALRGAPLEIDASDVERLSGPCFQVLAAARKTWESDEQPFVFTAASPAFDKGLVLMGATAWISAQEDRLP
ncbi:STAS domain-containing protein [Caulobacter mirabilis]|uniref:STAS domain-containing protein n=1 Tax=Caulobacter mirabilis TaxID=69666 RepID=UPI001C0EE775|nr:STAS domain-containing protein [Caulobacter mirabilis]